MMVTTSYWLSRWGYRSFILWHVGVSILTTKWGWRSIFGLSDRAMYRSRRWSKMPLFVVTVVVMVVVIMVAVMMMILMGHRCWTWCISTTPTVQRMTKIRRKAYLLYSAKYSVIQP